MPKKTRRMKQRAAERRSMQAQAEVMEQENAEETTGAPVVSTPARVRSEFSSSRVLSPLTFEYSHIYGDLKRIALFASFFFIVLIVLSFIIK